MGLPSFEYLRLFTASALAFFAASAFAAFLFTTAFTALFFASALAAFR